MWLVVTVIYELLIDNNCLCKFRRATFNKTSFVEKLELFFGLGFMVDCYDWFWLGCMWLIVMKCLCWGVCG